MSASPFDSALYRDLFGDAEVGRLFSDSAEVRAMMLVLGALARVQGQAGVIPEMTGAFLHRAAMELQIDPAGLAEATGQNGVSLPGLVTAMRKALEAPEHAPYLHWGATSQDIQDTGLMLRLRQALSLIEARLVTAARALADLAEAEAETPMAARTYGQVAVPSSFGALVTLWGWPVLRAIERLRALKPRLSVSLSGAGGTGTMLGPDPAAIRAGLAKALSLADPRRSWHADRTLIAEIAGACVAVTAAGAKPGEDLLILTRSDVGEVRLAGGGASSTMPQKQNPVGPSVLVALARAAAAQGAALAAPASREARDGADWFTEWLLLPGLVMAAGKSAALLGEIAGAVTPDRTAMQARLADPLGLIHAETLSFALARAMPRPEAQAEVKRLTAEARETGTPLPDLVAMAHPGVTLPPLTGLATLGTAPAEARAFAAAARAIGDGQAQGVNLD
jgi:3-carboxy-cis,cis-muconate cycloisomerase